MLPPKHQTPSAGEGEKTKAWPLQDPPHLLLLHHTLYLSSVLKTAFWEAPNLDKVTSEQAGTPNFKGIDIFERFQ